MRTRDLPDQDARAKTVLRRLMAVRELNVTDLSRITGYTRQTAHEKVKGETRLSLTDISILSEALNVEPGIFFMDPDEAEQIDLDRRRQLTANVLPIKSTFIPFTQVSTIAA